MREAAKQQAVTTTKLTIACRSRAEPVCCGQLSDPYGDSNGAKKKNQGRGWRERERVMGKKEGGGVEVGE